MHTGPECKRCGFDSPQLQYFLLLDPLKYYNVAGFFFFFQTEDEDADKLTDGDPETYWESDGTQGQHWIRLRMKKGTIIK